mmetsp:Transcript_10949/g.23463  ORF Transcript_10949/g.23463 Transcript_10949/m.23463 type:complete len:118 (-) Transcript_10949:120-473(-)|eukprot:scaffold47102_cov40-Tisochrysis_lutea.AAC.2
MFWARELAMKLEHCVGAPDLSMPTWVEVRIPSIIDGSSDGGMQCRLVALAVACSACMLPPDATRRQPVLFQLGVREGVTVSLHFSCPGVRCCWRSACWCLVLKSQGVEGAPGAACLS